MRYPNAPHTNCEVRIHYFGSALHLDFERFDPRDHVMIKQQHCGGNTLTVFEEKLLPGSVLTVLIEQILIDDCLTHLQPTSQSSPSATSASLSD